MGIFSFRSLSTLAVVLIGVSGVSAQEAAPVGEQVATALPAIALPSRQVVLTQCAVISLDACTALVRQYMDALVASGLSQEEINQVAANFVIELASVAQANPQFDQADLNSVDAIQAVITYIQGDDAQVARLAAIANTIESNSDFQTAAVAPVASPN